MSLKLFLVTATVKKTEYLCDSKPAQDIMRLIWASSAKQAQRTLEQHYDEKSHDYDVSYLVSINEVQEALIAQEETDG